MREPYPAQRYDVPMRRIGSPTHPYQDDTKGERIQKVLADAGVGSRRACEAIVAEGRVTVDGHRIDGLPAWVDARVHDIRVDGRKVRAPEAHHYVVFFKPKGVLSASSDPEGRVCATDLVLHPSKTRLYPVGRLEIDASGLLLLTNDGELANRLTHPRFEMSKGYEVLVNGSVRDADLPELERRIFTGPRASAEEGGRSRLLILNREAGRTLLYMDLRDNRNRDLRATLETFGHPMKKIRRVSIGPLKLKSLQVGHWRELTAPELAALREEAFATPQQRAARRARADRDATAKKLRGSSRPTRDDRAPRGGKGTRSPRDTRGSRPERPRGARRPG